MQVTLVIWSMCRAICWTGLSSMTCVQNYTSFGNRRTIERAPTPAGHSMERKAHVGCVEAVFTEDWFRKAIVTAPCH